MFLGADGLGVKGNALGKNVAVFPLWLLFCLCDVWIILTEHKESERKDGRDDRGDYQDAHMIPLHYQWRQGHRHLWYARMSLKA